MSHTNLNSYKIYYRNTNKSKILSNGSVKKHIKAYQMYGENTILARIIKANQKYISKIAYSYSSHDHYILDFYCYELQLGIEVDGYSHQFIEVYQKDIVKEGRMKELGITVLRFSDEQVLKDMENVLRAIEFYIFEFEKHTPGPSQEGS